MKFLFALVASLALLAGASRPAHAVRAALVQETPDDSPWAAVGENWQIAGFLMTE